MRIESESCVPVFGTIARHLERQRLGLGSARCHSEQTAGEAWAAVAEDVGGPSRT
jgi:hypothetical protein